MPGHNSKDLLIVIASSILALATIPLQGHAVIALSLLALPLVFILPGYALTAALFPRGGLGLAETLTSSIGLSLAAVIVGGVILNLTPEGLTSIAWTIFLVAVTLGSCAIAERRRRQQPAPGPRPFSLGLSVRQAFFFEASIALIVLAFVMVRDESLQPSTAFTELWAKPAGLFGQTAFDIGVRNSEPGNMEYKLQVKAGEDIVYESPAIALEPGETWVKTLTFQTLVKGDVQVFLYRMDNPGTIYRQVVSRSGSQ